MNQFTFTLPASIGDKVYYQDELGRKWHGTLGQWYIVGAGDWCAWIEWEGKNPIPNPVTLGKFIKHFHSDR